MSLHSLTINFAAPSTAASATGGDLRIEQVPWSSGTGRVSIGEIAAYMQAMLAHAPAPDLDCGLDGNGGFSCQLMVWPTPASLAYVLAASRGDLDGPVVEEVEITETVMVVPPDIEVSTRYPAQRILTADLVGQAYDAAGAPVDTVTATAANDAVLLSRPVFGQLRITYVTMVHGYGLHIDPDMDAMENRHACTVYGRWHGGVRWLEIEPPPDSDRSAEQLAPCGFGHASGTIDDLPEIDPSTIGASKVTEIDYCSQETISERIV